MEPFTSVPDEIRHNPFRVLGCLSSSGTKERISNRNRLAAFARVGKPCSFPTDLPGLFGGITRSPESIDAAEQALDLPEDLIRHAFFWFCSAGRSDDAAIERLQAGGMTEAVETWERRRTVAAFINLSVLATCRGDVRTAVALVLPVIRDKAKRTAFLSMLGQEAGHHDEAELLRIYIGALSGFLSWKRIHDAVVQCGSESDIAHVEETAIAPSLRRIENAIAARDGACGLEDGRSLLMETKDDLALLDEILAPDDLDRSRIHERLADRLQDIAGNAAAEDLNDVGLLTGCLELAERARDLAQGEGILSICRETVRSVRQKLNNAQVGDGVCRISAIRDDFSRISSPSMQDVSEYVESIMGILLKLQSLLDANIIRSTSSEYCGTACDAIRAMVDELEASGMDDRNGSLKSDARRAILIIDSMHRLSLNNELTNRFRTLRERLSRLLRAPGSTELEAGAGGGAGDASHNGGEASAMSGETSGTPSSGRAWPEAPAARGEAAPEPEREDDQAGEGVLVVAKTICLGLLALLAYALLFP